MLRTKVKCLGREVSPTLKGNQSEKEKWNIIFAQKEMGRHYLIWQGQIYANTC